jgi:hypothetical protein
MNQKRLRKLALAASILSLITGIAGMACAFLFLAAVSMEDIAAGMPGFIAGAILIGSGVIGICILANSNEPV